MNLLSKPTDKRSQRKNEHVQHALNQSLQTAPSDFDGVHFIHQSLPSFNLDDVNLSADLGPFRLDLPLYINAMTGGSEWTRSINGKLAAVAEATGIPMAVGSMHAAIKQPELSDSFTIARETNPNGLLFANVGADVSMEGAKTAVDLLKADALQIHINAPQELIMPEGDRNFKAWRDNIQQIAEEIDMPVIVKEVGFGMSKETLQILKNIGIKYTDVSGKGGTNFATIENSRRKNQEMSYMDNWGISTVTSLLETKPFQHDMHILASGGVRTPLDAMKCLALGARAVGMSKMMLEQVEHSGVEAAIEFVDQFHHQMKKIAVITNAKNIEELRNRPIVLSPELISWQQQRSMEQQGRF
ncbi:type 2 isopentenyl-diphosphate Delta-isomerase [Salinicoccus siamensis]|uniref:Isopentenyl-diphosphate delta-isomerase n=1 Tax=Salinicoccus siamensis TaxID=381830 RepID=A0ABV5Z320_9STAP